MTKDYNLPLTLRLRKIILFFASVVRKEMRFDRLGKCRRHCLAAADGLFTDKVKYIIEKELQHGSY